MSCNSIHCTLCVGLHADNEELRKQVAIIPKLERACSRKEKQAKEAARVMKGALDELEEAKRELALAHEENRRLQKAYDKLRDKYDVLYSDWLETP